MHWVGGGLIPIIIYGVFGQAVEESFALITENGADNILTELSQDILTEDS
jgi:hypothetical protein